MTEDVAHLAAFPSADLPGLSRTRARARRPRPYTASRPLASLSASSGSPRAPCGTCQALGKRTMIDHRNVASLPQPLAPTLARPCALHVAVCGPWAGKRGRQTNTPTKTQATSGSIPAPVAPHIHDGADPSRSLKLRTSRPVCCDLGSGIVPNAMEGSQPQTGASWSFPQRSLRTSISVRVLSDSSWSKPPVRRASTPTSLRSQMPSSAMGSCHPPRTSQPPSGSYRASNPHLLSTPSTNWEEVPGGPPLLGCSFSSNLRWTAPRSVLCSTPLVIPPPPPRRGGSSGPSTCLPAVRCLLLMSRSGFTSTRRLAGHRSTGSNNAPSDSSPKTPASPNSGTSTTKARKAASPATTSEQSPLSTSSSETQTSSSRSWTVGSTSTTRT